jgi:hypothetical protein
LTDEERVELFLSFLCLDHADVDMLFTALFDDMKAFTNYSLGVHPRGCHCPSLNSQADFIYPTKSLFCLSIGKKSSLALPDVLGGVKRVAKLLFFCVHHETVQKRIK